MRILVGLALQPIVTAGVAFLLFPLSRGAHVSGSGSGGVADAARAIGFTVGLVSVPLVVFAVVPVMLWLRRHGRLTLASSLMGGVVFGNVPIAIGWLLAGTYGPLQTVRTVAYASAIGLTGAAVFWLVVSATRDERQA
jgi:hypothetical protein